MLSKVFVLIFVWMINIGAHATELVLHASSWHATEYHHQTKLSNNTSGVGVVLDSGIGFGVFTNSFNRTAAYVGYQYMFNQYVGVSAAVASGYTQLYGDEFAVIGGLVFRLPMSEYVTFQLTGVPKITGVSNGAIWHAAVVIQLEE